jgi:hypothetical protein
MNKHNIDLSIGMRVNLRDFKALDFVEIDGGALYLRHYHQPCRSPPTAMELVGSCYHAYVVLSGSGSHTLCLGAGPGWKWVKTRYARLVARPGFGS